MAEDTGQAAVERHLFSALILAMFLAHEGSGSRGPILWHRIGQRASFGPPFGILRTILA